MPFAVTTRFLTSSCMKRQESEGASPLGFFLRSFMLSKAGSRSQPIEQDCHSPGVVLQPISKQAISLLFFIFPSKKWLKRKSTSTSVRATEIPWNAAVTFMIPPLPRRLCCAIVLGSHWVSAGMWKQGRDTRLSLSIKHSTSHHIRKNSGKEMPGFCTRERERTSGPDLSQLSLKSKTLLVLLLHPLIEVWDKDAAKRMFEGQVLKPGNELSPAPQPASRIARDQSKTIVDKTQNPFSTSAFQRLTQSSFILIIKPKFCTDFTDFLYAFQQQPQILFCSVSKLLCSASCYTTRVIPC